jgi:hypothetical protein
MVSSRKASGRFVMFKLGAGYGRWAIRGGIAARFRGLKASLLCVEAEPQHAQWLREALELNGLAREGRVEECTVCDREGLVPFLISVPVLDTANWYGQVIGRRDDLL